MHIKGWLSDPQRANPSNGAFHNGLFLAIVLVSFFLVRYGYREIPLERDEGMYLYTGARVLSGAIPYVDIMEAKPPGLFLTYAALYALAAGDLEYLHLWFAWIVAANTLLVFALARKLLGTGPALTSAVMFSTLSMSLQASGFTLQSEHLVVFFGFAGILLTLLGRERQRWWHLFLAGALLMWSTLIKQNGVFFMGFSLTMLALPDAPLNGDRARAKQVLLFLSGSLVMAMVPMAWLVQAGAWDGTRTWLVEVAAHYVSRISPGTGLELLQQRFIALFKDNPVAWSVGLAGIAALLASPGPRSSRRTSLLLLAFSTLAIVPGFRFFGHYFLMLFPALAISAAWGAHYLSLRISRTGNSSTARKVHLGLPILLFMAVMAEQRRPYFTPDHNAILRYVYTTNPFPESKVLAEEINRRSSKGDELLVMGFEPQIHVYTGLGSPTRWHNMDVLLYDHPIADRARAEFTKAVTEKPPRFVVWVQHVSSWMPPPDADQSFLAGYWEQLKADYEVVAWYEQYQPMQLRTVIGEAATRYVPSSDLWMFLAVRKEPIANTH